MTSKLDPSSTINKNIGLSHLRCFAYCIVIDTLGFDFRGTNKKFEIKWKPSSELNSYGNSIINSIVKKFQMFESKLDKITDYNNIFEYNVSFESRTKDRCNHSAYLISDDICHILNFLKAHD